MRLGRKANIQVDGPKLALGGIRPLYRNVRRNRIEPLLGAEDFRWIPAVLTYCVPFFVFLLGQRSAGDSRETRPGESGH